MQIIPSGADENSSVIKCPAADALTDPSSSKGPIKLVNAYLLFF
jgi:hypothetical protein